MVSVIIPNYNHASYLDQRIESIINQTHQDFELIILDDCSTDGSQTIIDRYKTHPKISQVIYNTTNSGSVFKQWKKGIDLAKGSHIWIAESDDWAHERFLETLLGRMDSGSIGLAYCDSRIFLENEYVSRFSDWKSKMLSSDRWKMDYTNNGVAEVKDSLFKFCSINNASAVLFKREALVRADVFDYPFRYVGDWYAYIKILNISDVAYVSEPLNNYREHKSNASKNALKDFSLLKESVLIRQWIVKQVGVSRICAYGNFYRYTIRFVPFQFTDISKLFQFIKIGPVFLMLMIAYKVESFLYSSLMRFKGIFKRF